MLQDSSFKLFSEIHKSQLDNSITYIVLVGGWTSMVETLEGVAFCHLQAAYAGLKKSLYMEWTFFCAAPNG